MKKMGKIVVSEYIRLDIITILLLGKRKLQSFEISHDYFLLL